MYISFCVVQKVYLKWAKTRHLKCKSDKCKKNQRKVLTKVRLYDNIYKLSQKRKKHRSAGAEKIFKIFLKKVLTNERVCGILKKLLMRATKFVH
jgi:hypothetical protein